MTFCFSRTWTLASLSQSLWRQRLWHHSFRHSLNSQMCFSGSHFVGHLGTVLTPKGISASLGRWAIQCEECGETSAPWVCGIPQEGFLTQGTVFCTGGICAYTWNENSLVKWGCRWEVDRKSILDYRNSICKGMEARGNSLGIRKIVHCV